MKGRSILYTIFFLSSAEIQSISEGKEKKYFKTGGRLRGYWDGISFSLSPYTNKDITERCTLSLVSTSLDISREAWLILNTALDTWRVSAHLLG